MRALIVAAAMLIAAPALAQAPTSSATLADSSKGEARTIIDGASWRCDAGACTATGGANQPAPRACRRVVAKFGAVSAFTYKGVALSAEELTACNA
ncbi:CC_3452 family protein [Brevundimonas sp. Root1279]|uniref:CC_3452 family protein n=1 Tax=Brevundimonas sp. Root1279 TaxID=1736443 RepID=UPI0006FEC1E7|nr:hypothetical protein [Brevundimonas sp. Root1279]KQW83875.1 hypothetical protein ASC65_04370 [Brevundimonas sp. Root1279]